MVHEQFLKRTNASWKPKYAFRNTSFNSVVAKYRELYKTNKSPALLNKFNREYQAWLLGQKALENNRKREFQQLISSIRVPKTPLARQPSSPRSGQRRSSGNKLRRAVLTAPLKARRNELQRKRANLERQRNNLERQINGILVELRGLPRL
jgi:hypothetical protein